MALKFPVIVEIKDRFEDGDGSYWRVICNDQEQVELLRSTAHKTGFIPVIYGASPLNIVVDWMNKLDE